MEQIGQRIKRLRLKQELSINEVARRAIVPVSTYREWENGRKIKGEPYVKIAEALNVTLIELLTGEKPKSSGLLDKIHEIEKLCVGMRKHLLSSIHD